MCRVTNGNPKKKKLWLKRCKYSNPNHYGNYIRTTPHSPQSHGNILCTSYITVFQHHTFHTHACTYVYLYMYLSEEPELEDDGQDADLDGNGNEEEVVEGVSDQPVGPATQTVLLHHDQMLLMLVLHYGRHEHLHTHTPIHTHKKNNTYMHTHIQTCMHAHTNTHHAYTRILHFDLYTYPYSLSTSQSTVCMCVLLYTA